MGRDPAVKAKAAPAVNGAFSRHMDHGGGGKVVSGSKVVVDNRQQWQRQSGSNQLKVMLASGGLDSHGGSGKQWRSMGMGSKMPMGS